MRIYENEYFFIEQEKHALPWLKIFTKEPFRELTDMPQELRTALFELCCIVEEEMRDYFHPEKINIASFGNVLQRVHIHLIARFEKDAYFPNSVWGEQLREERNFCENCTNFFRKLHSRLIDSQRKK